MADLSKLPETLGVSFRDASRLVQALIHCSYVNENPDFTTASNERLEFLGDAILNLIVAEKLYQDFPHFTEGEMTKFRAALVRQDTLTRLARVVRLGDYLYLGKGEESSGGRDKPANLASALEAVIATIFLDQGLTTARNFVLRLLGAELDKVMSRSRVVDYKSELQELIQSREQRTPTYHVIATIGPAHDQRFTIEVRLGETVLGQGSGKSKKIAESAAARAALEKLSVSFTP